MANHLKMAKAQAIQALREQGWSLRRIARTLRISRVTDIPDRRLTQDFSTLNHLPQRLLGSLSEQAQLELAHRPLQAEQQSVIQLAGIIDTIIINHQRFGHSAEINQVMPITIVASQPGRFQGQHGSGPAFTYSSDQASETRPLFRAAP